MVIDRFSGEYRFLSNFFPAEVNFEGMWFGTVEHAYQAAKTISTSERERIKYAPNPGTAKRWGRNVTLRPDWEERKIEFMEALVEQKFRLHPSLRLKLLRTGETELIEGNTWGDTFWGVCNGQGQNHLGKILMLVRSRI